MNDDSGSPGTPGPTTEQPNPTSAPVIGSDGAEYCDLRSYLRRDRDARGILQGYDSSAWPSLHLVDLGALFDFAGAAGELAEPESEAVRKAFAEFGASIEIHVADIVGDAARLRLKLLDLKVVEPSDVAMEDSLVEARAEVVHQLANPGDDE